MASKRDAFATKRATVLVVSFERPERVRRLQHRLALPFTFVVDRDCSAYEAFGLGGAPIVRTYLDPRVIWGYVKMIAAGELPDLHRGQDRRQLGGDFVIDAGGAIVFAHPEQGPEDRAPVTALLRAL